ncbi:hypothetical protein N657DRAFT_646286 [Parathielavia appendiculata]|uniref:Gag1-like clamp domain-containing protein n=1 Tax=Parathielavia appendiculata TaxID=2587402 RepID=A0AAN6TXM0_9PEZI|nr:hypothetical protein N657DRAFT_646286 [Parathielavia appendiculata]
MESDKDRLLSSSEAHELSNQEPIHDFCPRQLGEPSMSQSQSQQAGRNFEFDEDNGLGKTGLLGEGIIPLSGQASPHTERHLQPPALSVPIKTATLGQSRAAASGEQESLVLPVNHAPSSTMIFSDLYKSPKTTFSKIRNSFPHGLPPPSDLDADLVSRDKARNKEAVRKYLDEKVRNDWEFTWPPVAASPPAPAAHAADEEEPRDLGEEADSESDAESVYSTISEDPVHFRPRAEWTSDLSDSDEPRPPASPFRFDNPKAVGAAVRNSVETKRARRRRAVRDEMKWNPGLACFEARRNAWTGAKTVRVKPKPPSPVSPSSARRLFWRHHRTQSSVSHTTTITPGSPPTPQSPLQRTATRTSTATGSESDSAGVQRTSSQESTAPAVHYPVQTVLPVPPPLLPPQNPMRASVQPSMYGSLYDKVVVQNMQPSCPVNLADMLRACVVGWKRDGEWPPKPSYPAPAPAQTSNADVLAARQRKAQLQRNKNAVAVTATTTNAGGRRLSFVGFFNGGGGVAGHKTAAAVTTATAMMQDGARDENKDQDKEGKENGHTPGQSHSHSDEGAGSSGKALFRRSLQRVLSLGQHGHAHGGGGGGAVAAVNGAAGGNGAGAPLSPTSPTTKEVTAAG